jgi:hypothetical protein
MALYLGRSGKVKVNINGVAYCLNLFSKTPIINGIMLISSDDYILKDIRDIYLTAKDGDE